MKTLFSLFVATFLCVSTTFADDAAVVANWKFPMIGWFPNASIPGDVTKPAEGIAAYPRAQVFADSIGNFNTVTANFDAVWTSLSRQGLAGAGYPLANVQGNVVSDHGAADFTGAFKVVYDANNIFILLKYHDDTYMGTEEVEIMWAPYFSIDAIAALPTANKQAPYARYGQFGGYKATYLSTGFKDAMICDFNAAGVGDVKWSGTNDILSTNLFMDIKNTPAVGTAGDVKEIYTIGYQALTGNAYTVANANGRPNFDPKIWRALNAGKGISFDIKVKDTDADDALNTANNPVKEPAQYVWNSTVNDVYAVTYYAGFAGIRVETAVNSVFSDKAAIFGDVTSTQVKLTNNANVEVFNSIGKRVMSLKNTMIVDLSNMNKGVYIIRANNETLKFAR